MKGFVLFCTFAVSIGIGFAAEGDSKVQPAAASASHAQDSESKARSEAEEKRKIELIERASKCMTDRKSATDSTSENRTASVRPADNSGGQGAALVKKYCLECHNGNKQSAFSSNSAAHTKLTASAMPPKAAPQPSAEEKAEILKYLAGN